MSRALKVCATPGCPELVDHGHCPTHRADRQRTLDQARGTSRQRGYTTDWDRNSRAFLEHNPTCIDCGHPATISDHAPTRRTDLIAAGVANPDAWEHLQPRCLPCHSARTVRDENRWG